ncbi:PucR family transcriptional regulator [Mycolicibacterium brumae]|uniref:PucR family transcriptional regulator n=1 Tax=Mycolicibacterium brumae TaxID=85968 RepID=A0A2G5PG02_9MYCO|nr:PucR family transcriptional regulator [Mycolicibacterium brumae]MCV7194364.1 PucR family transcriptional regulator [Mycolicibacterium brumae]PIB77238.1 PucR family transcriptional regulator [Mycolicibacterium brumae]RWA15485.1 hypothetical protein MBRU_10570 [Mycolicibacterium brumae DSM 44177]UWW10598.1 PucR family transcriptional regulator [Mycolicibacterium brumae]
MITTVADVVALPVVQAADPEVLAAAGLDNPVRWVHISDVADLSSLLQGGELVLTTGGALRRSPRRYLELLVSAGAIGVIVEVLPTAAPLPEQVGPIAAELGLPLVALHREVRFVEITEAVHRGIVADQYQAVEFARSAHEIFTDLSMERAGPSEIAAAAARLLDAPVVLEDLAHRALAVAAAGRDASVVLRDWERRSRRQAGGAGGLDTANWAVTEVGRAGDQWGRLIAVAPASAPDRTSMVLERAAQTLVIHRMAERGRSDIEHQAQAGLIDDVLRQRVRSEDEAIARALALGLRRCDRYIPAAVRVRDWAPEADPVRAQRRNTRLLDTVLRATRALGHTGLFTVLRPGEVGMVLGLGPARGGEFAMLQALGRALRRDCRAEAGIGDVVLAVAPSCPGLIEAVQRVEEAAHVAEVAAAMPPGNRQCFRVSDIRLRGLLALLRDDSRVQRFAETELQALILHDLQTGEHCMETLRGYLELGRNKSALAARLLISRPALYARLRRIEEILNVDLADGESLTSLHVAVLILDARQAFSEQP